MNYQNQMINEQKLTAAELLRAFREKWLSKNPIPNFFDRPYVGFNGLSRGQSVPLYAVATCGGSEAAKIVCIAEWRFYSPFGVSTRVGIDPVSVTIRKSSQFYPLSKGPVWGVYVNDSTQKGFIEFQKPDVFHKNATDDFRLIGGALCQGFTQTRAPARACGASATSHPEGRLTL